MKIKYCFYALLLLLLSSCSDLMNPIPTIEIDPKFPTSGFTDAAIISQNESDKYTVTYSRTYGISRELTMSILVDQASLDQYNEKNGTAYKLLPAEFYTMPTSTKFDIKSTNASFDVIIYSKKLYEASGSIEEASKYVLPIKAVNETEEVAIVKEDLNQVFLHIDMASATISPLVASSSADLSFVGSSASVEKLTMEGTTNFEGVDVNLLSVIVDEEDSKITGGEYVLLPKENYSFAPTKVTEDGNVAVEASFNGVGLKDKVKYILPCYFKSADPKYVIAQDEPIYYTVTLTELKLTISEASASIVEPKVAYSGAKIVKDFITVSLNAVIADDITINFAYQESLISEFNTKNKTDFGTLPTEAIKVINGKIVGGEKSAKIAYSIDISSLKIADGKHYLVPLKIDEDAMEDGSIDGSNIIYLDVARSLEGTYNVKIIENGRVRSGVGNQIIPASKGARASDDGWKDAISKSQYVFTADTSWDGYCVLFSVTDEDMPGKANCKKINIYSFLELIVETGGTNKVTDNKSYLNTETGEVYIDCYVYESWFAKSYKETYSFTK